MESKRTCCLLVAVGAAGVVALVALFLLVGGSFLLGAFGLDLVADQVRRDIEDNPVVLEHVGAIEEIEVDFVASMNEPATDVLVFRLQGSRGTAVLTAKSVTVSDESEDVTWGVLRVESGETYDLFPDQGPKPE